MHIQGLCLKVKKSKLPIIFVVKEMYPFIT